MAEEHSDAESTDPPEVGELVDHLFRRQYGRLVSVLTSAFGLKNLGLAEDLVQDTLLSAMHHWSVSGVPDVPEAWLMRVAKNKALNLLKQHKTHAHLLEKHPPFELSSSAPDALLKTDMDDSQLGMMFACCHPEIALENQLALVLKTLCGFGSKEVARALLVSEEAVNKRLYRAKRQIVERSIELDAPGGDDLPPRLEAVCTCLYLLYNEGYKTTASPDVIKKDLCLEAMRLTKLLVTRFDDEPSLKALMALMCLHTARFDSRTDESGAPILFREQDRSRWDQELIGQGLAYLSASARGDSLSAYHLEASVAAQHCVAESFEATNWSFIQALYEKLLEVRPNPIVQLNLAIVVGQVQGPDVAVERLQRIAQGGRLRDYPLLHASLGALLTEAGRPREAIDALERALALTEAVPERDLIEQRLAALRQRQLD